MAKGVTSATSATASKTTTPRDCRARRSPLVAGRSRTIAAVKIWRGGRHRWLLPRQGDTATAVAGRGQCPVFRPWALRVGRRYFCNPA